MRAGRGGLGRKKMEPRRGGTKVLLLSLTRGAFVAPLALRDGLRRKELFVPGRLRHDFAALDSLGSSLADCSGAKKTDTQDMGRKHPSCSKP